MFPLHIAIYSLLGTALTFSIIELGLTAYVASYYTGSRQELYYSSYYGYTYRTVSGDVPPIVIFLLFTSIWSDLACSLAFLLPWFYARKATGVSVNRGIAATLIFIYFVTMVFWLASFADLANRLSAGYSATGYIAAIIAFSVLLWLLFLALFILTILGICGVLKSDWPGYMSVKNTQRTAPAHPGPPTATDTTAGSVMPGSITNMSYSAPHTAPEYIPYPEGVHYGNGHESVHYSNPPYSASGTPLPQQSELSGENVKHG